MYAGSNANISFSNPSNFSLANGGFSTVWGAGIRLWDSELLEDYGDIDRIYEAAKQLLSLLPYSATSASMNIPERFGVRETPRPPNSGDFDCLIPRQTPTVYAFETALALDVLSNAKCVGCGNCLSGCPYGAIFDSGNAFDEFFSSHKYNREQMYVEKIVPHQDYLKVLGKTKNGEPKVEKFNEIYLCAGAIGTPSILLNSNLISDSELIALDSQVFYFIGLKYFQNSSSPSFALSQITLSAGNAKEIDFKASLYRSNAQVRQRISQLIKSKSRFPIRVPKFMDRFLFLGIGFLDSENSGRIEIRKVGEKNIVRPIIHTNKAIQSVLITIRKYLKTSGYFVIPGAFIKPLPGLGFHSGGALPIGSKYIDEFGCLREEPRIRISDVSLLKSIPAGAHTFSSMTIIRDVIKRDYENSNHRI
jgi:ferredoxin